MGNAKSDRSERGKHTVPIQTWVTSEVADWVADHAEAEFMTVSSFLRRLIHREMERGAGGAPSGTDETGNSSSST